MQPQPHPGTASDLEEQRARALVEMDVPLDDARRYLSTREFGLFRQTLAPAADAYVAGGQGSPLGDYRLDQRTIAYRAWLIPINERKQAPLKRRWAEAEYDQFIHETDGAIRQFRQLLDAQKRPHFAGPPALEGYQPDSWYVLRLPTLEEVAEWANPHIEKKVPSGLADFVSWKVEVGVLVIPHAMYEVRGMPCLVWEFKIRVLATVQMELAATTITRSFCGYEYQILVGRQELGYCYVGPVRWGRQVGFVTPIALIALLGTGRVESDDISLLRQDGRSITFLVAGYDGKVTISMDFRRFIIDMARGGSLADGLRGAGVIDQLAADVVQKKLAALPPPAESAVPASDDNTEVETALGNMGYAKTQIAEMISSAHLLPGMSTEDKVREVLRTAQ